jgi:hypothetical protein
MNESTASSSPDVLTQVLAWRQTHPQASFAELEAAVEAQLDQLRSQVLEQAALAPPATTPARPTCPTCGAALQARGERERRLTAAGGQQVRLRRPYYWCSPCAVGLFPPG